MAKLTLKSEQQILGSMAQKVLANTGLNDLNPGSVLLTLLQAAATEDFAQYYQMLQIVRNFNLDTTTGSDLDNRAFEYGLQRNQPIAASGRVDILRESTFVKKSTTFYSGFRSRIAGDTQLFVNNAAAFPSSGAQQTLIIGRGTPNEEEVTYTPSGGNPSNFTNYYQINLDIPLTKDHSLNETVILKQGVDIFIAAGAVVRVPASGRTSEVTFKTTVDATILAGDDSVTDVNVICNAPGSTGNIGVNAITGTTAFSSPPFIGARAVNNSAFSNGQDKETDTSLRSRIKAHVQALSQSTKAGISNAINGLVDPSTAKKVVSSNIILPDNVGLPVSVYIDDGTGFEPDFSSQGQEIVISSAKGGETRLQLNHFPLVKANLKTLSAQPYNMATNALTLQINVGNQSETLQFFTNMFAIPEAATSEEIVKAINGQSLLVEARTADVGTNVVINAKAETNEDIQIISGSANSRLNFPLGKVQTFYLYLNDKLLSKDGETAFIDTANAQPFDFSGADKQLSVVVDGKGANPQTVTIHQSDFASPAAAASASAEQLAVLVNNQLAGATAVAVNGKLRLISNTTLSAASKIQVQASTANSVLGFPTTQVAGKDQDYTLNPELGVIELVKPLVKYDLVTAGTRNTRAFLTASIAENYAFSGGETLAIKVDGGSTQTITFTSGVNLTAQAVADRINATLIGASATTRTRGNSNYLEIRTNSYNPTLGSIEILSSSTANTQFGFSVDTVIVNILPHEAYQVAGTAGPYSFIEGNTLVVVLDNDSSGKTFVITMSYGSKVTSGTDTTHFGASGLINIFLNNSDLTNFYVVFKDGANTISGAIEKVDNPSPGVFKYTFKNPAPTNFQDFAVGDQATFSGMNQAANNGNFLVSATVVINNVHSAVKTKTLSNPASLTPLVGDRYLIGVAANTVVNANSVIDLNVSNPTGLTPSINDRHIIAPAANSVSLANVLGRYTDSADVNVQQVHGYRYIINGTGLNAWVGHNNQIAQYNGIGSPGWLFIVPSNGDVVFSVADNKTYQFDSGTGTWIRNDWGGKAGKIATWNGTAWVFTNPIDQEVRNITSLSKTYQYAVGSNTWTENDWGGSANKIAQWNGSSWTYESPTTNDTVVITDESTNYQYDGSSWNLFKFWIEVSNSGGIAEPVTTAGSGLIGQRRQISAYDSISGAVTLSSATRAVPTVNESIVILPSTRANVVTFFNNTKITSLSTAAFIELVNQGQRVQISSQQNGSDGYVEVTGGKANNLLQFSNSEVEGLRAYSYYIGLVKLVHSTIYGDEQDLETYPGVGAAGIKFIINGPTVNQVGFTINVTLGSGVSLSNVENEIITQITSYVNGLGVASPVILANIVELVMQIQGIVDVSVVSPSANVVISQNEKAASKASLISVNVVV